MFTAKDAKRMRDSCTVFIDWGEGDMSVMDLHASSKRFKKLAICNATDPDYLERNTNAIELEIQYLEAFLSTFQGA